MAGTLSYGVYSDMDCDTCDRHVVDYVFGIGGPEEHGDVIVQCLDCLCKDEELTQYRKHQKRKGDLTWQQYALTNAYRGENV
jgi:hypothetical protein